MRAQEESPELISAYQVYSQVVLDKHPSAFAAFKATKQAEKKAKKLGLSSNTTTTHTTIKTSMESFCQGSHELRDVLETYRKRYVYFSFITLSPLKF